VEVRLRELDLAHVELSESVDSVALVHHGGRLALRPGQDDVHELLARRHHRNPLEIEEHHGC